MFLFSLKNTYERADAFEQKKYSPGFHYKYNQVIDEIGFGPYQYKIIATIALVNVSLGIFAGLLPFLIPLVKMEIEMETFEIGLLISVQSFGSMLGGLLFSYISDLKGRRISMLWGIVTTIICSVICTFFSTFYPFVFFRFLAGIGYGGVLPVGVTYLTEYLPDHNRGSYLLGMEIFRCFGGLVCIFAAYIWNNSWRFFVLAPVVVLTLTMLIIFFFLPESSRYLLFRGKTDRVVELLQDMWEQNSWNFTVQFCEIDNDEKKKIKERKKSIWNTLFIRKWDITVPLLMLWFFPAFGMGVFIFLPEIMLQLGFTLNEIYMLNSFLLLLPMFGIFITTIIIDSFGRKQLISISSLVAGLSLMCFLFYPNGSKNIIMFYVILGVFSIFMKVYRSVTYAYTPEVYSTSTRTSAVGVMSAADRFASILQPMIFSNLVYSSFKLSLTCFGAWLFVTFFFSLLLTKETSNKPLKESFMTDTSDHDIGRSALYTSMISDT